MIKPADLPDTISLFPLPGALLLPRSRLPLHIFEPRYLQMLEDALKTPGRLIGMIQPRGLPPGDDGSGKGEAPRRLNAIGCAGRVTAFSETEDGRYMITLSGVSRFRLLDEVEGFTPYLRGRIDWGDFTRDLGNRADTDPGFDRARFLDLLKRYFDNEELAADWETLKDAEDELLLNSLSMLLPFDPEEKQVLLEAPNLSTRRETLVTLLEFALRSGSGGQGEEVLQ